MLIYHFEKPLYVGGSNIPMDRFPVHFNTSPHNGEPYVYFEHGSYSLPLAEARKLARKILSMPVPIDFKEEE